MFDFAWIRLLSSQNSQAHSQLLKRVCAGWFVCRRFGAAHKTAPVLPSTELHLKKKKKVSTIDFMCCFIYWDRLMQIKKHCCQCARWLWFTILDQQCLCDLKPVRNILILPLETDANLLHILTEGSARSENLSITVNKAQASTFLMMFWGKGLTFCECEVSFQRCPWVWKAKRAKSKGEKFRMWMF